MRADSILYIFQNLHACRKGIFCASFLVVVVLVTIRHVHVLLRLGIAVGGLVLRANLLLEGRLGDGAEATREGVDPRDEVSEVLGALVRDGEGPHRERRAVARCHCCGAELVPAVASVWVLADWFVVATL